MQPNEKQSINQMFERETKREKNLEARAKELRNEAKKAANKKELEVADGEDVIKEVEETFFSMTTNSGIKFDDTSPLDVELPPGTDLDA